MRLSSTGAACSMLACCAAAVSFVQGCGTSSDESPPALGLDAGSVDLPASDAGGAADSGNQGTDADSGNPPPPPPPPPTEATRVHDFREAAAIRPYALTAIGQDLVISGADNFQQAGVRNAVAMRVDLVGDIKWAKKLAGISNDQFLAQVVTGTSLHALGITRTVFTGPVRNTDVLWAELDTATGAVLSSRHLGTTANEDLLGAAPVPGGVVIVGTTVDGADAYIARLTSAPKTVAWARRWATPGTEALRAVRAVPDGIVAFGQSSVVAGGKLDPVVVKFDNLGNHVWSSRISGGPEDEVVFSARVVSDGFVLVGQTKPSVAVPVAAFAMKLSLDGTTVIWAKSYATAATTTFRGSALVTSDPTYGLPETLVVSGFSGSSASVARIATTSGVVVTDALDLTDPTGGALASDHEVVWERPDRGLGFLYYATPMGSNISSLGMALPNRLLGFSAACALANKPVHSVSDLAMTAAAVAPAVSVLPMIVGNNGAGLPVSDLALIEKKTCN